MVLTEKNLIAETGSSSRAIEFDHIQEEIEEVSAVPEAKEKKKSRNALRKGLGGEEVRAMQEALQKLGFYSGEEDMESSSFSSGTARAVKTWQASLDAPQDGIMTAELLERQHKLRVWITKNRWEDSSRLSRNQKKGGESKTMNTTTRCLTCRGEGRLLCTECDGTGEPSIEEQVRGFKH
ncbi:hypothetical protein L3X38_043628 [Prunus dulcis]|uniref:Peptidoglycan binding-like domain-containing protein n=1 Tax=Prunus dulcis TaxID=3755 RepID=A0AAD4YLG0_PRUDU|nr:hypothetical protein L3X38_043628 [Prunus dulcis]